MTTFYETQKKYLKLLQTNDRTKRTYKKILNKHWTPYLGEAPIKLIDYEVIMEILINKELSNKYINQILIPLRGVFDTAIKLRYIDNNPMDLIKNRKIQTELPDPFSRDEMEKILNWLQQNKPYHYLFYELAFWSGLRPCELLALSWQDIFDNYIYVHKSRLDGKDKTTTKTNTARQVILNARSKTALDKLHWLNSSYGYVFVVPTTKRPYYNNYHFKESFKMALFHCKIRDRPSYNARHTYATMLLMDGVNPTLVANQLGHSLQMLIKNYARWLNSERDFIEISKLKTT